MSKRQRRYCPQCSSINISRIRTNEKVYYICNHCGHEFSNPIIEPDNTRRFGKLKKQ